jgi:hypothetical protein
LPTALIPPTISSSNWTETSVVSVATEGDDMHHALVVEDMSVSLLLEKKAVNVDNHLMLSSAGRINKVKMCQCHLLFDYVPVNRRQQADQIAEWS